MLLALRMYTGKLSKISKSIIFTYKREVLISNVEKNLFYDMIYHIYVGVRNIE